MLSSVSTLPTDHHCLFLDTNTGETAIAAYWVTDGVDRCCVGFLPRHCVLQANNFDGRLVQVVTIMCANSENPRHSRQFARWNRAACHDAADITTNILSGSTAGTVGSNGQVHSTQERINYIASIASSVFEERDDDYSEETETKLNVVEHSSPNSNVKKAAITNQKC